MKKITVRTSIWMGTLPLVAAAWAAGQAPEPRYQETRELMTLVAEGAALVGSEGAAAACNEFRVADSRWLHGDTYMFVLGMDAEALCHPARPGLEGRNLRELRDPKGRPIVGLFLRELEAADEGWVHYLWPRPDQRIFEWKTSHLRRVKEPSGRELIVGSGRYLMKMEPFFVVEQVEDAIELIRERGVEEAFAALRDESSGFLFYNAYVFVLDENGTLLVNNAFPENEGKDLRDLEDSDGKAFVREMLAVPAGGSAWIDYKWPRPGDTWPSAKSSFVRNVEIDGRRLYVGSGVYFGLEPKVQKSPTGADSG